VIGQVVTQMRAIDGDCFTVRQTAHQIPIDFRVPERRPAVVEGLFDERSPRTVPRRIKERFACVRIIKSDLARRFAFFFQKQSCFPVPGMLRVVPAKWKKYYLVSVQSMRKTSCGRSHFKELNEECCKDRFCVGMFASKKPP